MEFEAVFEYRHKKFGLRKRSVDDGIDLSVKCNQGEGFQTPAKRFKIDIAAPQTELRIHHQVEPMNLSPRSRSTSRSEKVMEVIDVNTDSEVSSSPQALTDIMISRSETEATTTTSRLKRRKGLVNRCPNEVQDLKKFLSSSPTSQPTRSRRPFSRGPTRLRNNRHIQDAVTDSDESSDLISVKVKEELIEINTCLKEKIPGKTFEDICRFHENMVRSFPKKNRSLKEQERRNKNTVACRKSRRVRKLSAALEENEYKMNYALYINQIREKLVIKKYSQIIANLTNSDTELIVVD